MELFIYAEPTRTPSLSQISRIANVFILTLMTCTFFVIPHRAATAQTVHIPDHSLRFALKSALGKEADENITQADMASLKSFDAPALRIRDISGLEFAVNLTNLNLEFNRILDISPLENLTNLEILDLDFIRRLSDISPLDISPLRNLTNLQWLSLRGNQISNISPLKNLTNLIYLHMGINYGISDVSPIRALKNLTFLDLESNKNIRFVSTH